MLIGRAPVRISFAGGGTDLRDYYSRFGGMVVSAAIDKYFYAIVSPREDKSIQLISADYQTMSSVENLDCIDLDDGPLSLPKAIIDNLNIQRGLNLFLASEIPPGTGLGSSGAVAVTLLNTLSTLNGGTVSPSDAAERAFYIETEILGMPIGKQDQYASAHGGLNAIYFEEEGVRVEPLRMDPEVLRQFERNLMLFFTGSTRNSATILRNQRAQTKNNDSRTLEALHRIKHLGQEVRETLEQGDLDRFGDLLHEGWENKKRISSSITNERIDGAYEKARAYGARGGKITGAGGGGFLMVYCDEEHQPAVRGALKDDGLEEMTFSFDFDGARVLLQSHPFDILQKADHERYSRVS